MPSDRDLFQSAIDIPDAVARAEYLVAKADEPEQRARIERLLAAHAAAGGFLEQPPEEGDFAVTRTAGDSTRAAEAPVGQPGTVIAGKYKLLQQIGEGGMGTVWMADQTEPIKRRVAVKLIRVDRGNSATILARFEAERQAIALMDHPHIAKLLDAGVTGEPGGVSRRVSDDDTRRLTPLGSPFFIMELVKGIPLTEYCDTHKLSVQQRLGLFQQICSAVQHAHQKGIIHRDLKPTNILVESHDGKPVPKVIDFGLAKATSGLQLTEHSLFTAFGSVMGTPLYMAPEQASFNAIDVDTRADIYALGIILYELLTGTTPLTRDTVKKVALDEMLKLVREQEAPTPSSRLSSADALPSVAANRQTEPVKLGRFVKGELDWIVLKALSKERDRRYETATGFAKDIERFLNHEPVQAGPVSTAYRMKKFVRRNRGQVIATSLVLFALLAGMVGTTWGLIEAKKQQRLAVDARLAEADRAEGERLAKQEAEKETRKARKQAEIAEAVKEFLERDLIAQANPLDAGRADSKPNPDLKLKTALDQAVTQIAKRFEGKPLIEASIRRAIGQAYAGRGLYSDAQAQLEIACDLYRSELAHADPADIETLVRGPYIEAMLELINLYPIQGQSQKALAMIPILEEQVRRSSGDNPEAQAMLETVAGLREVLEGKDPAKMLKESQETLRKLLGEKSLELLQIEDFTSAMKLMGQGKYPEAERALTKLIEPRHAKGGAEVLLWTSMLAEVYRLQGKYTEARMNFETSRDGIRKVFGEDHPVLGACHYGLAQTLLSEKKYEQAETESRIALAFYEKRMPDDLIRFELKGMIGAALTGQKKYAAAEPLLLAGYEGMNQREKTIPPPGSTRLPEALDRLIEFYTATNKPDDVKKWQAERAKYPELAPAPKEKK